MKSAPVPLQCVSIDDAFWAPRIRQAREIILPVQWQTMNDRVGGVAKSHAVKNFRIAAGKATGEFYGYVFQDSDVGKWLEAVAYSLATHPDKKLEKTADGMIDLIALAQGTDGYLNTAFTLKDRDKRWTNLTQWHELYCCGHLIEAAVAYYHATGKRKFLDVMARNADLIAKLLGPGKGQQRGYPGHPEAELALVKLYRATGERKYLELSKFFVDERGRRPNYFVKESKLRGFPKPGEVHPGLDLSYAQAHLPVRQQNVAVGHAVRAMYLYAGMTDVATETGDAGLARACRRLWRNVVDRQMYVTGGVGSRHHGEAFSIDYDLPNETAYTETCAAIGLVFWAQRMLQTDADGEYADVMERALYNGVLSGVSLDGTRFFYTNPLAQHVGAFKDRRWVTTRQGWFGCACCPPNLARMLTSLGGYVYSTARGEAMVNLYVGGAAELDVVGRHVEIRQKTQYPWKDTVRLTVRPDQPARFTLALRIPGWCRRAAVKVNGKPISLAKTVRKGYARIRREWKKGDRIELTLPMPVERIRCHPRVRQNTGRVALRRGPIVYCLEEVDNGPDLSAITLPRQAALKVAADGKLRGCPPVITARANRHDPESGPVDLYRTREPKKLTVALKAIPYFMWANRREGEMLVWIREE